MRRREWMIVKVPYGGGYNHLNLASPKNTRRAPDALHKEFIRQSIFLSNNGAEIKNLEWHTIDIDFWFQNDVDSWWRMNKRLLTESTSLFHDKNVLFLGGSHTVTYTTFSALSKATKEQCGLIVLDAHPDCCQKAGWPIHSDWLRKLVEERRVNPKNVLVIGIRQMEKQEYEFFKSRGIEYFQMSVIDDPKVCITDNLLLAACLKKLGNLEAAYLSIDIDVVSQAFAPGTGCPSPGGLTDSELIYLVKQLKFKLQNLKAADLVEINPLKWWQKLVLRRDQTVDLGVKIIKEIVS
ncbi:MAG: arginase family protein [Parcubacteria group bacterium]|nr:arginase family protein [Parcubacteria group bacterium]